jgi:ATP-dependent DNA helicase RecG
MLESELLELANKIKKVKAENNHIELKAAKIGTPKKLYDSLSSFSNLSGGGTIVFGIDEENEFDLCGVYDPQDLQQQVTNQSLQMEPVVRPLFTMGQIDGKTIVSAEISECDVFSKPCFYKGHGKIKGSFIRVGDADLQMTAYEVYSFEAFKRKIQDELRINDRSSISDLSEEKVFNYTSVLTIKKPNLNNLKKETMLSTQGMTSGDKPTLCGLMVLGKYPQMYYPQLSITAVAVPGTRFGIETENGERFIDNVRIEGTIPEMLDKAMSFVLKNTQTATIIGEEGKRKDKTEYPMKAIREVILNSLIHRDYSIHTDSSPVRLIIFNNRIEIENPGGLYGRITIDNLGKTSADTRNPFIAGALEVLMETENRFSGIPTIINEMEKHGLIPPVFESERGVFKAILYNKPRIGFSKKKDLSRSIIDFCNIERSKKELAERFGYENTTYFFAVHVAPLIELGVLRFTITNKTTSKFQKIVKVR